MRNVFFVLTCALCLVSSVCFAAEEPLGKAQAFFLQKQFVQAIDECARVIRAHPANLEVVSKANYLTGASYVNLFDFLTAKKNFRVVVDVYKGSAYYEDAYMGLGDIEFLQENFDAALKIYEEFLRLDPSGKRRATLYFRLAELYLKKGDERSYKKFYDRLQKDFPQSFEARDARRLEAHGSYFTVQVGAFTNFENADKFIGQLKAKGYDVYSVLCMLSGKKLCRIRIGRYPTQKEAEDVKKRLEAEGHFAKIFPLE